MGGAQPYPPQGSIGSGGRCLSRGESGAVTFRLSLRYLVQKSGQTRYADVDSFEGIRICSIETRETVVSVEEADDDEVGSTEGPTQQETGVMRH